MARKAKTVSDLKPNNRLSLDQTADETVAQSMARKLMEPAFRNAAAAAGFNAKMLGDKIEQPGVADYARHFQATSDKAAAGDLAMVSHMLAAQAMTLDSMFTELARRSAMNVNDYVNVAERYGRLALKAQANSRATLDTLAKLHQPREQTVRHVHVNEGGQAIIADQFHNHTGGAGNANITDQSHATHAAGVSPALPSPDPFGNGVPIASRQRESAMSYARRD